MKKAATLALSLVMALGLCAPAFAETQHMSNFQRNETYGQIYRDVSPWAWYAEAVKHCHEYGLLNGTGSDTFSPNTPLSVAQALTVACRIHGIYQTGEDAIVPASGSRWYTPYVEYALANGLIEAEDFDDYTRPATRGDVAYLLAGALPAAELYAVNDIAAVPDLSEEDRYHRAVLLLYNAGVLTGSGLTGEFRPEAAVTRAEAAAIAVRMVSVKERRSFFICDEIALDNLVPGLKLYLPVGSGESGRGAAHYTSASGQYACEVAVEHSGQAALTELTKTEGKNALAASLAPLGYTMEIPSVSAVDVQFGDVPAYRYQFRAEDSGGARRLCFAYVFFRDGNLCMVSYLAVRDSTEFRTVADALTLDGAAMERS